MPNSKIMEKQMGRIQCGNQAEGNIYKHEKGRNPMIWFTFPFSPSPDSKNITYFFNQLFKNEIWNCCIDSSQLIKHFNFAEQSFQKFVSSNS